VCDEVTCVVGFGAGEPCGVVGLLPLTCCADTIGAVATNIDIVNAKIVRFMVSPGFTRRGMTGIASDIPARAICKSLQTRGIGCGDALRRVQNCKTPHGIDI
jgi:hypothetical protein